MSKQDLAMDVIGVHMRKNFRNRIIHYNYPAIVKLAYYDAITYNPDTGKGGATFGLRFNKYKYNKFTKPHANIIEELIYIKQRKADPRFDSLSYSDYLQNFSIIGIKDAGGPNLAEFNLFGRADAKTEADLEGADEIPDPDKGATHFIDLFKKKGFSERDIVALSYIYAFGNVRTYYEKTYTNFHVFDNQFYKNIGDCSLSKILKGDAKLKEYVDLFAKEKKEFYEAFTEAYLKLYTLGNGDSKLYFELSKYDY